VPDNLISLLVPAYEAAEADDLEAFDAATEPFVLALRRKAEEGGIDPGDDLILLAALESVLAVDPDVDDCYPAVIKTMRERIAHARHGQASQN
jgi:hypothetical protein